MAFMVCISSEGWIGFGRIVSAVAVTMWVHHAARWLEAAQLGEVMSLQPGRDVDQAFHETVDDCLR